MCVFLLVFSFLSLQLLHSQPVSPDESTLSSTGTLNYIVPSFPRLSSSLPAKYQALKGGPEGDIARVVAEIVEHFSLAQLQTYSPRFVSVLEERNYTPETLEAGSSLDNLCFLHTFKQLDEQQMEDLLDLASTDWLKARLGDRRALDRYVMILEKLSSAQLAGECRHILSIGLEDHRLRTIYIKMLESGATFRPSHESDDIVSLFYVALLEYMTWHGYCFSDDVPERGRNPSGFNDSDYQSFLAFVKEWITSELGEEVELAAPYLYLDFPDDM